MSGPVDVSDPDAPEPVMIPGMLFPPRIQAKPYIDNELKPNPLLPGHKSIAYPPAQRVRLEMVPEERSRPLPVVSCRDERLTCIIPRRGRCFSCPAVANAPPS